MKPFLIALAIVLLASSVASAAVYVKVKDGNGTVYWDKRNLSGYFKFKKEGGGNITFSNGQPAYIFDKAPTGLVFDANGQAIDTYYIYNFNLSTGKYEYRNGNEVVVLPEDK